MASPSKSLIQARLGTLFAFAPPPRSGFAKQACFKFCFMCLPPTPSPGLASVERVLCPEGKDSFLHRNMFSRSPQTHGLLELVSYVSCVPLDAARRYGPESFSRVAVQPSVEGYFPVGLPPRVCGNPRPVLLSCILPDSRCKADLWLLGTVRVPTEKSLSSPTVVFPFVFSRFRVLRVRGSFGAQLSEFPPTPRRRFRPLPANPSTPLFRA